MLHAQTQQSLRDGNKVEIISNLGTLFPSLDYEGREIMGEIIATDSR